MASNRAAYLTEAKCKPLVVKAAPMPTAKPHQVVIKVQAVAINPVDVMIQSTGFIIEQFPSVIGCDMAGEVAAIGSDVKHVNIGDRVLACVDMDEGDTVLEGCFQNYTVTDHKLVAKIPDSISYTNATVLPLGIATAATALFDKKRCMGLELPHVGAKKLNETLLVWGGASSVGSCAVQLARGAGYDVITTCSPKSSAALLEIGAVATFDYKDEHIVEKILDHLKGKKSAGVFSAVMDADAMTKCNQIASKADGYKHVGTVFPATLPIQGELLPDVKTSNNHGCWVKQTEVGDAVFVAWIPEALANGDLKCKPSARIVAEGLDKIQDGLDAFAQGVSNEKIVVSTPQ